MPDLRPQASSAETIKPTPSASFFGEPTRDARDHHSLSQRGQVSSDALSKQSKKMRQSDGDLKIQFNFESWLADTRRQFMIDLLRYELAVTLPTELAPEALERLNFLTNFRTILFPWMIGEFPSDVLCAFLRRGGSDYFEQYLLSQLVKKGIQPDLPMVEQIKAHSTVLSVQNMPVDFNPFLADVQQWIKQHAAFYFYPAFRDTTCPSKNKVLQVINWLQKDFTLIQKQLTDTDFFLNGLQIFNVIARLFAALDKLKKVQFLQTRALDPGNPGTNTFLIACDFLHRVSKAHSISFEPKDLKCLQQHLDSFDKGYRRCQLESDHGFISNFFISWFDPVYDTGEVSTNYSKRAHLVLKLNQLIQRDRSTLSEACSSSSTQSVPFIYLGENLLNILFTSEKHFTVYEINRILLSAFFEPQYWTSLYAQYLHDILSFIRTQRNLKANADNPLWQSYPETLLLQIERLCLRYQYYSAGQHDRVSQLSVADPSMENWPVLAASVINPNESFRLVAYLCSVPTKAISSSELTQLLDTKKGFDPNARDCNNNSLLAHACDMGNEPVVAILLKLKATLNTTNCFHETPFDLACFKGHTRLAELLLEHYPAYNKDSALLQAAKGGATKIVGMLLMKQANVNTSGLMGLTPLHLAILGGHADVVNTLIHRNANINAVDIHQLRPIYYALCKKNEPLVIRLLSAGAFIDANIKSFFMELVPEPYQNVCNALINHNLNQQKKGAAVDGLPCIIASKMLASFCNQQTSQLNTIQLNPTEITALMQGALWPVIRQNPILYNVIPIPHCLTLQSTISASHGTVQIRVPRPPTIWKRLTGPLPSPDIILDDLSHFVEDVVEDVREEVRKHLG